MTSPADEAAGVGAGGAGAGGVGAGADPRPVSDAEDAAAVRPHVKRRAWVSVDTTALAHNLGVLKTVAGPSARVIAVIKADAYGHGLVPAARAFLGAGAAMLAVATVDEVLLLRGAGIRAPVLLLSPPPIAAVEELVAFDVVIPVSADDGGRELAARLRALASAARTPRSVSIHLEAETGLTRMGVPPERCGAIAAELAAVPGVAVDGLWSHLACPEDAAASAAQAAELARAERAVLAAGIRIQLRHLAASGGLLTGTAVSYGGRWVAGRPSRIMTLPIGYGDGYARSTGPGAEVL
ncbi:MAG: alanine racemase, partial [Thermoleophilia bacterium]|nr:alanine racemase [Thermoleophilia bacterium]